MGYIKREEHAKACKKIHKVLASMVAVRMMWVLNMVGTAPAWRISEGCESPGIRLVVLPFLGSTMPVKPFVASHQLVPLTRFDITFAIKIIEI